MLAESKLATEEEVGDARRVVCRSVFVKCAELVIL